MSQSQDKSVIICKFESEETRSLARGPGGEQTIVTDWESFCDEFRRLIRGRGYLAFYVPNTGYQTYTQVQKYFNE